MRSTVRLIDILLCKSQGIVVFSQDRDCILRIQRIRAAHSVSFAGQVVDRGEAVIAIHLWNERMPQIAQAGADLAWALLIRRKLVHSFRLLASMMKNDCQYTQVRAVCGASAVISFAGHSGGKRMMQHLGFTVLPYHRTLGKFGEFWENLFSWWLMWAYNAASLHSREFWHLQRTEIWINREEFIRRYAVPS
jgi:hypothetical protein